MGVGVETRRHVFLVLAERMEELDWIDVGQVEIGDHQMVGTVGPPLGDRRIDGAQAGILHFRAMTKIPQGIDDGQGRSWFTIYYENVECFRHSVL